MDKLPDELILHIISYLEPVEVVKIHCLSQQFLRLGRDNGGWKTMCFEHSRAEQKRRREERWNAQDASLVALRDAMNGVSGKGDHTTATSWLESGSATRQRAMANWEPSYPDERVDYYQAYIHRHAPIAPIGWLQVPARQTSKNSEIHHETTGFGAITDGDAVHHVVAPLDDGSICVWDMTAKREDKPRSRGTLVGRSAPGLLSGMTSESDKTKALAESKTIMTETGAVECVSIDSGRQKGFFAVQDQLYEVDLSTLQTISRETYPFAVTALSEAKHSTPITVGTTSTIHIHDSRSKFVSSGSSESVRCELISDPTTRHAVLAQPGPLSILHQGDAIQDDQSIWVAGRFTPLLNYDRRFFPRLRGTVHSGARISCIAALPYPHIPRRPDLLQDSSISINDLQAAKIGPGSTLLAAGVYKGKGSLELYGLNTSQTSSLVTSNTPLTTSSYQNRQTASSSKLLSVANHNASIVYSDGDGNLRWVERDGSTPIRSHNINADIPEQSFNQAQSIAQDASEDGIFSSAASEMPGQGDIVQKIIPTNNSSSSSVLGRGRREINKDDLLLWTGDGRIGLLGFGHECPFQAEALEEEARSAEEMALEREERRYTESLRRALHSQADETLRMLGTWSADWM